MLVLNVAWVFCRDCKAVLMCKRHKNPYLGLYNLLGGKVDPGEGSLDAAYRELDEESGITPTDLTKKLHHLMDFTYYSSEIYPEDVRVEVYVGKLHSSILVAGDEKELLWMDVNEDFFNFDKFAGEGNIGHIYEQIKLCPELM